MRGIRLQSNKLKMTKRFILVDGNTLLYPVTIDDPDVHTKPWTIETPFKRDPEYRMFEYACHEGNHAGKAFFAAPGSMNRRSKSAESDGCADKSWRLQ